MTVRVRLVVTENRGKEGCGIEVRHSFGFAVNVLFLDMGGSYTCIDIIAIKLCMYVSHIIWCVYLPKKKKYIYIYIF